MTDTALLEPDADGIARAADLLRTGHLVALPTETVYGLAADARSGTAVAGIFAAKGRPTFNPLIVHVAEVGEVAALAHLPTQARWLADAFWPGPLTLVLPRRADNGVADLVSAGLPTVAVRVPGHPVATRLLRAFGGPLAAPSANPSGRISPTSAMHVMEGLRGRIAAVLDGGPCPVGLESTILGFDGDAPVLLRPGGLPVEALEAVLGQPVLTPRDSVITAPGQMLTHYAPGVALRLDAQAPMQGEGWLGFGPLPRAGGLALTLSATGDLVEAAANLFGHLHALDAAMGGHGTVAVAAIPDTGLGLAINDRLTRAAAPRD